MSLNKHIPTSLEEFVLNEARLETGAYEVKKVKGVTDGVLLMADFIENKQEAEKKLLKELKTTAKVLAKLQDDFDILDSTITKTENEIRSSFELLFEEEDKMLTQQVDFGDLVVQIGKMSVTNSKEVIKYDKVIEALQEFYQANTEVSAKIKELLSSPEFKDVTRGSSRAGKLNPKAGRFSKTEPAPKKVNEGMMSAFKGLVSSVKKYITGITRATSKSEKAFNKLKNLVQTYTGKQTTAKNKSW